MFDEGRCRDVELVLMKRGLDVMGLSLLRMGVSVIHLENS